MDSLEWMELQTLAAEIAGSRARLAQARSRKDLRAARTLEQEILAAERRRDRLIAHISTQFAGAPDAKAGSEAAAPPPAVAAEQPSATEVDPAPEPVVAAPEAAPTASPPEADTMKGGVVVWDQVTPADIEHAKQDLGARRDEMLARHAEELKGLESAQAELDLLEHAIDAFLRKFKPAADAAAVVQLDERRDGRLQAAAGQA